MPAFARSFDTESLAGWDGRNPGNAVRALFERWALPGHEAGAAAPLRLALRSGYVNFYVKGQSVAKLRCGRDGPALSMHNAYVAGRAKPPRGGPPVTGYADFTAAAAAARATADLVPGWIAAATTYASAEKRFVDDLVAANPGVIDLEMGLPASDRPGANRVAPRMDLVVAQVDGGAPPAIAFWEAKCANNGELRSRADPKILDQVRTYVDWMGEDDRMAQVRRAYRQAAATLLRLHGIFRSDAAACLDVWRALAAAEPAVIARPAVVIGNYWPKGSDDGIASGRMVQCAASFARNGHREKLERHGLVVHEVGPDHGEHALPPLAIGAA